MGEVQCNVVAVNDPPGGTVDHQLYREVGAWTCVLELILRTSNNALNIAMVTGCPVANSLPLMVTHNP